MGSAIKTVALVAGAVGCFALGHCGAGWTLVVAGVLCAGDSP